MGIEPDLFNIVFIILYLSKTQSAFIFQYILDPEIYLYFVIFKGCFQQI
ncbi:unnamed protein product [Paramecium sonneborni]|uniref:Uncharacterized protein n=1 Tax=Paramecium sonneborni TaxID=65129 RepID=A0A8S1NAP7_9CILI|nr:unnamed protein product [Paramecium sonneborni]